MLGGKNRQLQGYTILEVMIVLAISGVMFVIASTFINGRAAETGFVSGVNEMAAQIQDVIEQVQDGLYSDIPLNCNSGTPNGLPIASVSLATGSRQGTNSNCIFFGKVLHFSPNGNKQAYEIVSVGGSRTDSQGNLNTDPTASSSNTAYINGLSTQAYIPQQLYLYHSATGQGVNFDFSGNNYNSGTKSFGLGFLASADIGVRQSGLPQVFLYRVSNLTGNNVGPNAGSDIEPSSLQSAVNASICLTDGTRYADILLSDNSSSRLIVSVEFTSAATC